MRASYLALGILIGMLYALACLPPPQVSASNEYLLRQAENWKAQVDRDDRILTRILGEWDRSQPLYTRQALDKRGGIIYHFYQDLESLD